MFGSIFRAGFPETEGLVLARHRSPGGRPSPVLAAALTSAGSPRSGGPLPKAALPKTLSLVASHRLPAVSPALRGRVVAAAVAAGALVAAGQTMHPAGSSGAEASTDEATRLAVGGGTGAPIGMGGQQPALEIIPVDEVPPVAEQAAELADTAAEVEALAKGERIVAEQVAREAEARRPRFVKPADGVLTSGFGARWGTTHYGVDIANDIGTPILAVADGTVVESGPASGFGMWVRLLHADGTTTVYGHINRSLVDQGEEVKAGDQIAEMGNRGYSTGPHLHFEVWRDGGSKIDPLGWLLEHGIDL